MAPKSRNVDDPFKDDDWGMPDSTTQTESDEMPEGSAEDKPSFIKPHHVGKQTTGTMELIRVTSETSDYSDVIFVVKFRGKLFRHGLKLFSPDYKALLTRFGKKREDWHGELRYKVMPHKGNPLGFIAIR
jgi:hypothetical protein